MEVMWLLGRLVPDHKTIADFARTMVQASAKFVLILSHCAARWVSLTQASVAIDGSKFKAVNNRDKNFTRAKMERRMAQIEESVARYLEQLDTADRQEPSETEENGLVLRRYWTNVCQSCAIKPTCTTGKERRITRWEHEHILEAVQRRLDEHPEKMQPVAPRDGRTSLRHHQGQDRSNPFPDEDAANELPLLQMALHVLVANLTWVMNIMGIRPFIAADEGLAKPEKSLLKATRPKTVTLRHLRQSVFTQPRGEADIKS